MTVRLPLLFDMRGFWADEKVDGGAWPAGNWKVRAARRIERTLLRRARAIAVITLEAQRFLRDEYPFASDIAAPIHVIPTAADLRRFSPEVPPDPVIARQVAGARVLGYVGSLGTWYMGETMARFYLAWRDAIRRESGAGQPTRLLVVTHSDVAEVRAILEAAGASRDLVTVGVPHARVPSAIRCMEAGVSFRRPSPSSRAGAPVKIGETLACGVPVASNAVGDVARIFGGSPAGVLVAGTTEQELRAAAARLEAAARSSGIGADARRLARRWFDLDAALNAYDELYAVTVRRAGGATVDAGWPRSFPPRP